jgi:hypothetical protein
LERQITVDGWVQFPGRPRQHIAVIQRYRDELVAAARAADLKIPIRHEIDLSVTFIDPCSPDLDRVITALFQALGGTTLRPPSLLR